MYLDRSVHLGKKLADNAVGVLVGSPLPWALRVRKVNRDTRLLSELAVPGHFLALVIRHAFTNGQRHAVERRAEPFDRRALGANEAPVRSVRCPESTFWQSGKLYRAHECEPVRRGQRIPPFRDRLRRNSRLIVLQPTEKLHWISAKTLPNFKRAGTIVQAACNPRNRPGCHSHSRE